jgi:translation initiation factor IF-2
MASKTETKGPAGVKVCDLAKELGLPSKAVILVAKELGIVDLKGAELKPSSVLPQGRVDRIKAHVLRMGKDKFLAAPAEPKKKPPARKPGAKAAKPSAQVQPEQPAAAEPETTLQPAPPALAAPAAEGAAPALQPAPAAAVAEAAAPQEPVAPLVVAPPVAEQVAPAIMAQAAVSPPPAMVAPAGPPPAPGQQPPQEQPEVAPSPGFPSQAARIIQAGPDLAPVIRKAAAPTPAQDPRFGVVMTAETARQVHGEAARPAAGRRGVRVSEVKSKDLEEFKAEVSYPQLPQQAVTSEEEEEGGGRRGPGRGTRRKAPARAGPRKGGAGPRHGRSLLVEDERVRGARKAKAKAVSKPTIVRTGPAEVTAPVTIKSLCESLGIKAGELIGKFLKEGKVVTINSTLSDEEALLYAGEFDPLKFGITIKKARDKEEELLARERRPDKAEDLRPRAPVVTIMGHVDHGKTSLLDYIRKSHVAEGEAGGITQHVHAYRVHRPQGDVVFLDTPGHKAFTEMRARGANVTDLVILVVAANDGVMPQTEEAISHAKAANRNLIVALNKIDLPDANPDKVKAQLAAKNVFVEGYGGQTGCVEVSAKTGKGVPELLDRVLLEAEVLQLRTNPSKPAVGTVIEAHKDQGRGIEATLLVQEGSLRVGDVIVCGHSYGTVRQLLDDRGSPLTAAPPSTPVLVTGLSEVPLAGERFHVLEDIKEAAEIADNRAMLLRAEGLSARKHVTLEALHDLLSKGQVAALRLILKVDVIGSLRPLEGAIGELATPEARVEILHSGVGAINETDVELAGASDAVVIGFSVAADPAARKLADERMVDIRTYEVIYDVVDEVRRALEGMLKPIQRENIQGHLTVRQVFRIARVGAVAGCFVNDGLITRQSSVRLIRDAKPVWSGKLASLKRLKDDAREVRAGFECGVKLEGHDDVQEGDALEAFTIEQVARKLS